MTSRCRRKGSSPRVGGAGAGEPGAGRASSPLFMSVALSTVIFLPMLQFGCFSASATFTCAAAPPPPPPRLAPVMRSGGATLCCLGTCGGTLSPWADPPLASRGRRRLRR